MVPKVRRIPRELFKQLIESRKYNNSKHFLLRIASSERARIAVTVSKKVSKKAVIRNRIRRRVYSVFKKLILVLKPNLYLVVAKIGSEKIKGKDLENELKLLVDNRL